MKYSRLDNHRIIVEGLNYELLEYVTASLLDLCKYKASSILFETKDVDNLIALLSNIERFKPWEK